MPDEKKYSEKEVFNAMKIIAKKLSLDSGNSAFSIITRAISEENITPELLQNALTNAKEGHLDTQEDSMFRELSPGDHAIFLQETHREEYENLKQCLSEFRRSEYGASFLYEKAKSLEPSYFFPRLFFVKVVGTAIRNNRRIYACKLVEDDGSQSDIPMYCPEENMFCSQDDIKTVRKIYEDSAEKSVKWLNEMLNIKLSELKDITSKLISNLESDTQPSLNSLKAFKSYDETI